MSLAVIFSMLLGWFASDKLRYVDDLAMTSSHRKKSWSHPSSKFKSSHPDQPISFLISDLTDSLSRTHCEHIVNTLKEKIARYGVVTQLICRSHANDLFCDQSDFRCNNTAFVHFNLCFTFLVSTK